MHVILSLFLDHNAIITILHRLFMGQHHYVHIRSIILQSTATNLKSLIEPLTTLDNVLHWNARLFILSNPKVVPVLRHLFTCVLSEQRYVGNEYIWNTFNTFVMNKTYISVNIDALDYRCMNKELLKLIFHDFGKGDPAIATDKNQNLIRPEILSIFKNVTQLSIQCVEYPICLDSLLSLIKGRQIKTVGIYGDRWLPSLKSTALFEDISEKYREHNFKIEFGKDYDKRLDITCI